MAAPYEDVKGGRCERFPKIVKTWIGYLGSVSLSLVGGLILAWWQLKYHPTNDQQWMVPLGLILFVTPPVVWLALSLSDICNSPSQCPDT